MNDHRPSDLYPVALHDRATRLFHLVEIQPGQWTDELVCLLRVDNLDSIPGYNALSYVWGSKRVRRPISVNGYPLDVTANLECALRLCRDQTDSVTMWIDAICINQQDAVERSEQVQLMSSIYGGAMKVIAYLGQDGPDRITSTQWSKDLQPKFMIEELPAQHLDEWAQGLSSFHLQNRAVSAEDVGYLIAALARHDGVARIADAMSRCTEYTVTQVFEGLRSTVIYPWWFRVWVVQEVVFARDLTVMIANVHVPWSCFTAAARGIESPERDYKRFASSNEDGVAAYHQLSAEHTKVLKLFARQVLELERLRERQSDTSTVQSRSLHDSLRECGHRKASDDRDQIYALLSLAGGSRLTPDYGLTLSETYVKATWEIIRREESLAVLCRDMAQKNRNDLPSWVPDWSTDMGYGTVDSSMSSQLSSAGTPFDFTAVFNEDELSYSKRLMRHALAAAGKSARNWVLDLFHATFFPGQNSRAKEQVSAFILWLHKSENFVTEFQAIVGSVGSHVGPRVGVNREENNGALSTHGYQIGTIRHAANPSWTSEGDGIPEVATALASLADWVRSRMQISSLDEDMPFLSTLTCCSKHDTSAAPIRNSNLLKRWFNSRLAFHSTSSVPGDDLDVKLSFSMFDESFQASRRGRSFFITEDGNYGWGPRSTRPHDEIYVLPSSPSPFVLRRLPNRRFQRPGPFNLLGGCYLHRDQDDIKNQWKPPLSWEPAFFVTEHFRDLIGEAIRDVLTSTDIPKAMRIPLEHELLAGSVAALLNEWRWSQPDFQALGSRRVEILNCLHKLHKVYVELIEKTALFNEFRLEIV